MSIEAWTTDIAGGSLKSLLVDWPAGTAEICIGYTPRQEQETRLTLRISGLSRLVVPREGQWRGEMGIAQIHGPVSLEHDRQHLRIAMKSGDVIELDYLSHEVEPADTCTQHIASSRATGAAPHPEIPDLHDAPLRDVRLCWAEGTADVIVGPLISTSSLAFGAEYVSLHFQSLRRFIFPRRLPWDYFNPDILAVLGPIRIEGDAWHLRLAMQDGDVIEVDYGSMTARPAVEPPPSSSPTSPAGPPFP